jgi:hypothetical protein
MIDPSKLLLGQWPDAIRRGKVTTEMWKQEMARTKACMEFLRAYFRPRPLDETSQQRWAKACERAGCPGFAMPDELCKFD